MTITINDKTVELKYNFYMFYIYENTAKESFKQDSFNYENMLKLFYCAVMARFYRKGYDPIPFVDFINWLDDQDNADALLIEFIQWITNHIMVDNQLSEGIQENDDTKEAEKIIKKATKKRKN